MREPLRLLESLFRTQIHDLLTRLIKRDFLAAEVIPDFIDRFHIRFRLERIYEEVADLLPHNRLQFSRPQARAIRGIFRRCQTADGTGRARMAESETRVFDLISQEIAAQ